MNNEQIVIETKSDAYSNDFVDFRQVLSILWQSKFLITLVTVVFVVLSVWYALTLPNLYKSEAILAPSSDSSGMKLPGQLGGLAAMAGVNLGGLSEGDQTELAIEILKSKSFITQFIDRHELLVPLMAAKGWNLVENRLIIDIDIYDESKSVWVRNVQPPFTAKPSLLEAHKEFMQSFSISKDKLTDMVKVSVEHYSPYIAKDWLLLIINDINTEMRVRDITEAEKSINYLSKEVGKTDISDVKSVLYSLIEEQTKTLMLANIRDEYVFRVIDPAYVPEEKSGPKRALIVILAAFSGMFFTSLVVLIRYFNK